MKPFLVKSYIGFNNLCNSGQNILKKFTIPAKCLQPFGVVGGCSFCTASNLLLKGLTQTFLSFINMMFLMYCNSVLNNWHFFGDILSPFSNNAFSISNFAICALFEGVNTKVMSIIALQCFQLCKHSKIAFMYDYQIEGEMFNPIGILWYKYEALLKYSNIPQYLFESSNSCNEWNASFRSNTKSTSHLEFLRTENVSLTNGYAKLFFPILMFKCLKSVTTLLSCVIFWLINITGLEYGENPSFNT